MDCMSLVNSAFTVRSTKVGQPVKKHEFCIILMMGYSRMSLCCE